MSVGISLEELLAWSQESSNYWKAYLDANPQVLSLPCDIGGTGDVKGFVRHIWGADLRWGQRLAGLPVIDREQMPTGPLDALFEMHSQAVGIFRGLLAVPDEGWEQPFILDFDWVPPEARKVSRRKIALHALIHSQRHWAQLATLGRKAGLPSAFKGDLLFSPTLR